MLQQSNNISFEGQNIFAGFDVHLKSWQVTLLSDTVPLKTFVMKPNPDELSNYLHRNYPGASYHSAYEAGFCGLWAHHRLRSLGIDNMVVNAADIPGTQKDKMQKEDKRDSRKIAIALRAGTLTPIYTPLESTLNDRSLIRSRKTLTQDMGRFKTRIKSFLYFFGIELPDEFKDPNKHWTKRFMSWLEEIEMMELSGKQALMALVQEAQAQRELLKSVTKNLKSLADSDKYNELVRLLRTIPGIGLINAMFILTEVEDINRFPNADKFASFIGLIPMSHSSGEKDKIGSITFRSHDYLRSAFIESAWVTIRMDPAMLLAYQKLVKRMEPNNAIVRIARKMANRTFHVLKQKEDYQLSITGNP